MVNVSYHLSVRCTRKQLWDVLTDKIENPAKYIEGVTKTEFEPLENGRRLRVMQRNGIEVKEIIYEDESKGITRFELKNHPKYNGVIETKVEGKDADLRLIYSLRWKAHTGEEDHSEIEKWFGDAVFDTKAAAETEAENA